jgi:hypothetical protein
LVATVESTAESAPREDESLQNEQSSNTNPAPQRGGRIKLDQGCKTILRVFRKCVKKDFESERLAQGKHHLTPEKFMERARVYLVERKGFSQISEEEVAALVLLVYPAFGKSEKKAIDKKSPIYKALGEKKMDFFKKIFENNSSA